VGIILVSVIVFLLVFIVPIRHVYDNFDINLFEKFQGNQESIKTGDLYFTRHCEMKLFDKIRYGTSFTHAGIFHRCLYTGRLFVFDFHNGLNYVLYEEALKLYKGHAFIRQKKNSLNESQLKNLQKIIDESFHALNKDLDTKMLASINSKIHGPMCHTLLMTKVEDEEFPFDSKKHPNYSSISAFLPCVQRHLFKQQEKGQSEYGIVCTDFIYLCLQRWGVLPKDRTQSCSKPDWFAYSNQLIDDFYFPTQIVKHFTNDYKRFIFEDNEIVINDFTHRI